MATVGDSVAWNSSAGGTWANSNAVFYYVVGTNSTHIRIRATIDGSYSQGTSLTFDVASSTWDDALQPNDAPHQLTSSNTWANTTTTQTNDKLYVWNGNTSLLGALDIPSWGHAPTGPTVTSHTEGIVITNDTITSSDFTWLKNGSAYSPTNMTLIASNTIGANNDTGYIYDFNKDATADYTTTIDSKDVTIFYFDAGWTLNVTSASSTRSNNSTRILNVLATIPSNTTIGSGSDLNGNPNPLTTVYSYNSRVITYTRSPDSVYNGYVYINFALDRLTINGNLEIVGTFYESRSNGHTSYSQHYVIGAQETMTYSSSLGDDTIVYKVSDWVYSDEIEGDNYTPPVSTTSNGGGKGYPLIMTNLFNRNKSLYSIGMTHKDKDLFFHDE